MNVYILCSARNIRSKFVEREREREAMNAIIRSRTMHKLTAARWLYDANERELIQRYAKLRCMRTPSHYYIHIYMNVREGFYSTRALALFKVNSIYRELNGEIYVRIYKVETGARSRPSS